MLVQFKKMLELQNAMNAKVDADWVTRNRPWGRYIWIEAGELAAHMGYKHWRKEVPNILAAQIEAVDIWHFGLSLILDIEMKQPGFSYVVVAEKLNNMYKESMAMDLAEEDKQVLVLNDAVAAAGAGTSFNITAFFWLVQSLEMSMDDLYKQYIGKNVLNFFRQDHGYKANTYVKEWFGREDNDHLVDIMDSLDISSPTFDTDVYAKLEEVYKTVLEKVAA